MELEGIRLRVEKVTAALRVGPNLAELLHFFCTYCQHQGHAGIMPMKGRSTEREYPQALTMRKQQERNAKTTVFVRFES
jgi:hypothetical protein